MNIDEPIIIIEDDPDDRDIIKALCAEIGICNNLLFFENAPDALAYLRDTSVKPFILLCDINMPGMDGLEMREEINKDEQLRKKSIPFIFFSTAASDSQVARAYDMTVQGFFLKENTFQETKETLEIIVKYWQRCKHPR